MADIEAFKKEAEWDKVEKPDDDLILPVAKCLQINIIYNIVDCVLISTKFGLKAVVKFENPKDGNRYRCWAFPRLMNKFFKKDDESGNLIPIEPEPKAILFEGLTPYVFCIKY